MAQVVFNEEWIVESRLTERTGLAQRQIKSYRLGSWIEGVHFKRLPQTEGACKERAVIWYNLPKINQLVQDA
ncbi:excisionase family protein [Klebsiella variicola]|nr:excisionase family protein [Klebsiella variicola]